jgi:hypothetical protein
MKISLQEILSPQVLKKAEEIKAAIIGQSRDKLVKRYGKDAEKVAYGRAIKQAKKAYTMESTDTFKNKITEMVKKSLSKKSIVENDAEMGADKNEEQENLQLAINLLDTLENLLKNHDWNYYRMDDYRKYKQGQESWQKIESTLMQLRKIGYYKDAKNLIDKYSDEPIK